ncbi:CRISPR-associated endonuclease Cas1 [Leptolyngbya sp. AN02str]|uniref:CRISPR-associated endonuclease Cas1 n=1 Tax=Leptolyngbya sp. AN02str TaxID=3423363 RepID=UPI003D317A50
MRSLYISQSGCALSLKQEQVLIKQGQDLLDQAQLPMLEQILIFGQSQVTTQLVRACLYRNIPIVYLSRMGRCYGRLLPIERGYRSLARQQQALSTGDRLSVAKAIVRAKVKNGRVLLQRQYRRVESATLKDVIEQLSSLVGQIEQADAIERLMGFEGAAAACYFRVFGECLTSESFSFQTRSRQPPLDPVNAMLSFGYQVLWNHLLSLIELQGLDPYEACLHQGSERHAALASDLVEEFRAPLVDSLVLYLVNSSIVSVDTDFDYPAGACYLNEEGRRKFLRAFLQRMEEPLATADGLQPRWDLLNRQVKLFKQFVSNPALGYKPYLIR